MGAGRKTGTFMINSSGPIAPNPATSKLQTRNLEKSQLGGVIFACKNITMKECLFKQLFGLPAQHFLYVKNIEPGMPIFLFNYSDRTLHGIFESASSGKMNIDPYGWTTDGSERTQYPAQVQICVRLQCQPLLETQFKPIIAANYYNPTHFWFELDHVQTNKLISLLASFAVAPGTSALQNTAKWRTIYQPLPLPGTRQEAEGLKLSSEGAVHSANPTKGKDSGGDNQLQGNQLQMNLIEQEEKDLILKKLQNLALALVPEGFSSRKNIEDSAAANDIRLEGKGFEKEQIGTEGFSSVENAEDSASMSDMHLEDKGFEKEQICTEGFSSTENVEASAPISNMHLEDKGSEKDQIGADEIHCALSSYRSIIAQLLQGMEELKAFKAEQTLKMGCLEQKLVEAEQEIRRLKDRCRNLESSSDTSTACIDGSVINHLDQVDLDPTESIYLVGGFDGESWLSSLDSYFPLQDVIKSWSPMNSVRSYTSVAKLRGELYVFGGGNGYLWYDTVESYNPANDQWTLRPSLRNKKGSLAGAALDDKIFAIGGGNGMECFSEVEMLDLDVGEWIPTRSMLQKRFALAGVELNGILYACGGFDGIDYLETAERFDPREHSWTKIASMNTRRGCHSLVVLNEKLYALGGFDGISMVPTMEIYDPRLDTWVTGDQMHNPKGYSGAAVLNETIYVIGGVKYGENIMGTVEFFKEGQGWREFKSRSIKQRCFLSATTL